MKRIQLLAFALVLSTFVMAQNPNFHIYLCFGQSNMQGSAPIEAIDTAGVERFMSMASTDFLTFNDRKLGKWYKATPPLSQPWAHLSIADYFGRNMVALQSEEITIGVVSVAVGGCDIRLFDKDLYLDYVDTYTEKWFTDQIKYYGGCPYERLLHTAKLAQRDGVIKGIVLHQGETNTGDAEWPNYVKKIYENLLKDLSLRAEEVPLLSGEVVHKNQNGTCASMNEIIDTLPEVIPTAYVIPSDGCEPLEDNIHFNSAGVRELGKRYAEKMFELQSK